VLKALDSGGVDLAGGQGCAQRLQGGADLEILLASALVRLDDREPAVRVAENQALRGPPPCQSY
jgi:hypothetical protein